MFNLNKIIIIQLNFLNSNQICNTKKIYDFAIPKLK